MRAVIQRVSSAEVEVEGRIVGRIHHGLLVYLGAAVEDTSADVDYLARKIIGLRVFEDETGKMSLSVVDCAGAVLVVSQFTLFGDVRRGRRPSFEGAAPPDGAKLLYEELVTALRRQGLPTETGQFRAHMVVRAEVDGPVTILVDSRKSF